MRYSFALKGVRAGWLGLLLVLSACGDREGSVDAAMALAEANYPGQLELIDSHLQKGHYDVVFARKDDAFTRIRFGVDPDPSRCRVGTRCEERLRRAYAIGVAAGEKLKAVDTALKRCGVPALGLHESHISSVFHTMIELDLPVQGQQPALDRLTPCVAAFRAALPADAAPEQRGLAFRILLPGPGGPARPVSQLAFETSPDRARMDEISYLIGIGPDETAFRSQKLRVYSGFLAGKDLREKLAGIARETLDRDASGGHVPKLSFLTGTRLDPDRRDVIRTYILACSEHRAGQGPCREDIAVRLGYDLATGEVFERAILRDIRDGTGNLRLPELPGRGVG